MSETRQKGPQPVVTVSARKWSDVLHAAWMFPVIRAMKQTTILVVTDEDVSALAGEVREVFGSKVVRINGANLKQYYDQASTEEAKVWAERWQHGARRNGKTAVTAESVASAARMYLALSRVRSHVHADVVAVDCNTIRKYGGVMPMPCLSHFQMNNDGLVAVCSADLNAACAQAVLTHITKRPGAIAISAPGKAGGEIGLSHSACTNRLFGPLNDANPYMLRTPAGSDKGAYVTTQVPRHEPLTLVDLDIAKRRLRVATAETAGALPEPDRCRTCVVAKTSRALPAGTSPSTGACVMAMGAYVKRVENLARLLGLETSESGEFA